MEMMRNLNSEYKNVSYPISDRYSDRDFKIQLGWRMIKLKKQNRFYFLCIYSGEEYRIYGKIMESVSLI
jgi:hypothetical protein